MTLRDKVVYAIIAAVIAAGMVVTVNHSIDSQTDVLREIRNSTRAEVCVLAIAPDERTSELVSACLKENGL